MGKVCLGYDSKDVAFAQNRNCEETVMVYLFECDVLLVVEIVAHRRLYDYSNQPFSLWLPFYDLSLASDIEKWL